MNSIINNDLYKHCTWYVYHLVGHKCLLQFFGSAKSIFAQTWKKRLEWQSKNLAKSVSQKPIRKFTKYIAKHSSSVFCYMKWVMTSAWELWWKYQINQISQNRHRNEKLGHMWKVCKTLNTRGHLFLKNWKMLVFNIWDLYFTFFLCL